MKKFLMLALLALAMNGAYAQSNVPNGDFENWYNVVVNASLNYDDIGTGLTDNWMATLNSLATVPFSLGGPGPVTVFRTTDKYSGTYAAKAISKAFPLGVATIFIPGMIGTAKMDMNGIKALLGQPCHDCKPLHFTGYYKYEPASGDSCAAVLLLSKWNTATHKRDTIGYGKMVQKNAVATYTKFDVPVNYTGSGTVDTMTMLVVSSAGFNVINFEGSVGRVGSTMYVDALMLEYPAGIQQQFAQQVGVTVYPNPAKDVVNVDLSKEVTGGTFDVYNTAGKLVGSFGMSQLKNTLPVSNLSNGVYYYRLMDGNQFLNTGSFVISK